MDFSFSEEQEMLRGQARSLLEQRSGAERVVELAESDTPWDPELWKEMAALGWTGLSVAEEHGGSGMGFLDEAVIFEELGHSLYPGPYFTTVGLALPALARDEESLSAVASGELTVTLAPRSNVKAAGSGAEATLDGTVELVPDLGLAQAVVVPVQSDGGLGLWLVSVGGDGVETKSHSTMDATRRLGSLTLSGAKGKSLGSPGDGESVLERIGLRAGAAAALEAVGIAQKALDLALEHTKTREQFDKPIGSYQAVSHQVADTYMDVELTRSLAYWAAWCVAENDDQVHVAVPAAKAAAAEAAVRACERSIQVHGGIGFTWEHILHRYYKRAQWLESFQGYGHTQRAEVAGSLLGR
jgi:alkylation response protein AidB-like acyl-CoA dehydrogenase